MLLSDPICFLFWPARGTNRQSSLATLILLQNIIQILDGRESNMKFYGTMKSNIGRGEAEPNITFQSPMKLHIGRPVIQHLLYSAVLLRRKKM